MSNARVASRYAKSLFELALEQKKISQIKEDMLLFKQTCDSNRELKLALINPIIQTEKKRKVLDKLFTSKFDKLTIDFIDLVCHKNRENVLVEVATEFLKCCNVHEGIVEATIKTATKLDASTRDAFVTKVTSVTGKKVNMKEIVDASVIGGFILTIADLQIDDSLASSLKKLSIKFSN